MIKNGDILQGRYRILRPLGSGGFAAVYKGEDLRLAGRPVAIKHFYTALLTPEEAQEMAVLFQSEAHTLARLVHPNLAQVYDYFTEGGDWFLVMEFVPGEPLSTLLNRVGGPIDQYQVIEWSIELCRVFEYLHNQDPPLIFRDLKPSNVILTPEGHVILIDFGIVRSFKEGQAADTYQLGTPGYAPPEQYGGQTEPRSDLYSLGVTMCVLLTGERPTGATFQTPSLAQCAPWVSSGLADLVKRATAYDPDNRPPSAAAMRRELEALRETRFISSTLQQRSGDTAMLHTYQRPRQSSSAEVKPLEPRTPTPLPALAPVSDPAPWQPWGLLIALVLLLGGVGTALYVGVFFDDVLRFGNGGDASPTSEPTASADEPSLPFGLLVSSSGLVNGDDKPEDIKERDLIFLPLPDGDDGQPRVVAGGPASELFGDRRGDGWIVFTRAINEAELQICVASPDGSQVKTLTSGNWIDRAGVWSPDGNRIAFESNRHTGDFDERDIFVMNEDGTNIRPITSQPGWQGGPAWSPDGLSIAYHSRVPGQGNYYELWTIDLATGTPRRLVSIPGENIFWPSWSPDGKTIAFMIGDDRIYLVPADGGTPTMLDLKGSARWPRWSPDGSLLAFESERDGIFHVYVYSVADQTIERLDTGIGSDRWPGW